MPAYSQHIIQQYLQAADNARTCAEKGRAFEDLACYVFGMIPGLEVSHRNQMNTFSTEEIDVAFYNDQVAEGLKALNFLILVECKNWSNPVSSIEVNWFISKIEGRGLDFGILLAANGITGDANEKHCAHDIVSKAVAKSIYMIVFTRAEIEALQTSEALVRTIKRKLCEVAATGTVFP
jgi:hypothetical protein